MKIGKVNRVDIEIFYSILETYDRMFIKKGNNKVCASVRIHNIRTVNITNSSTV